MAGHRSRWFVVAGLAALVLAAGAAAATLVRWDGSLGYGYGNGVGMPVRVGQAFSVGMTELRPARRVRIEAVRLHGPRGSVRLVGALVLPEGGGGVGTAGNFPPHFPRVKMRPAVDAVVPAHSRVQLVVGLRATGRGSFSVRGIDVLYRERWHGLSLRRRAHTGVQVQGCAVTGAARVPGCSVPRLNPDG